jgi:methylglutaconyl-CoA hydratase
MSLSNSAGPVLWNIDERGVATVVLNRPEVNNAYDGDLVRGLLRGLEALSGAPGLRAVLLKGNGRHFQAGADLNWISSIAKASPKANVEASRETAEAVHRLNLVPVPTVALVQGGCFGGGTGIIAACDVVIAADNAVFSISEVRWGLTAAIIIPQLNAAVSLRQLRRYALTGERFSAQEARRIGLVHEVVPPSELETTGAAIIASCLENAPAAIAETKALALELAGTPVDQALFDRLVAVHAAKRQSREATEGLASFSGKRRASWSGR